MSRAACSTKRRSARRLSVSRGVGTAITNASAASGVRWTRSLPDFSAAVTSVSSSGSSMGNWPDSSAASTRGLGSTPMTVCPATASMLAVGSPT